MIMSPEIPRQKILIVDNSSDKRALIVSIIASLPVDIIEAESGREALRILLHQSFALILLNVKMPVMDGFETAAMIRSRPRNRRMPIIFITAYDQAEIDLKQGYRLGAVDFLFTPIVAEALRSKVTIFCELAASRSGLEERVTEQTRELEAEIIERRKTEDMLRESEATLRSLINASSGDYVAFWDTSDDLHFTNFSPTSELTAAAKGVMETEKPLRYEGENNKIWFDYNFNPVFSVDGDIRGAVLFARDITERKEAENARLRTQKMESLGALAGGVAHDINNMLLPVLSLTPMVMKKLPEGSPDRQKLEMVLMAAQRMKGMAAGILAFSRSDEGEVAKIDIFKVYNETVGLLRSTLPATIKIRDRLDPDVGMVLADPRQAELILMNLASNAADAMEGKTGELAISLSRETVEEEQAVTSGKLKNGHYAKLTVADTGCGMDAATMQRIYEPLFTTKEKGKGTGLGLSMVFGVVAKVGGAIRLASEIGKGTTFDVYLPLAN
ncbi:MAG: hypothetical protein A3G18_02295 [Rhodospirillales bacterium RIFCSPLOWO2_12_FULL_58_28]|nr:MAG: hypothetical protein A3H92_06935 [Rhodospirillales bacterium RIFCSPLOWO2_02_FULL_58_16]OHC78885.1 MAG: hypothetical protein A3G18_02295 [Rhodospirillales bacterium RIFCSPLOWO2_12_FULL_58_28]